MAQGQGATSRSSTDPTGLTVVVDFDSVIAERNVTETLLTTFSGDRWWSIDEELERGTITSFEAVNAFFDLIAAVPEHDLRAAARQVEQGEHARVAVDRLVAGGASVVVVSDSFGFYVREALEGWPVTVETNDIDWASGSMVFPQRDRCCPCQSCGMCKQAPVKDAQRERHLTAVVSGSLNDRKAALLADELFASGRLGAWCDEHGVRHHPFVALEAVADRLLAGRVASTGQSDRSQIHESV